MGLDLRSLTATQMGPLQGLVLLCLGLNYAQGAVVPLVGRNLDEMLPHVREGHLLDNYPGMFGVIPGSEQEHGHHLAKRAPARYGYRGYSRGGGGGNRARTKLLFGGTALTAGAAGVALCL